MTLPSNNQNSYKYLNTHKQIAYELFYPIINLNKYMLLKVLKYLYSNSKAYQLLLVNSLGPISTFIDKKNLYPKMLRENAYYFQVYTLEVTTIIEYNRRKQKGHIISNSAPVIHYTSITRSTTQSSSSCRQQALEDGKCIQHAF